MAKDLRTYLDELLEKRPKDVVVVDREVDPHYEASAIVEKFERENRFPLVFFKNVKGSKMPLVINLGATYERLALALGEMEDDRQAEFRARKGVVRDVRQPGVRGRALACHSADRLGLGPARAAGTILSPRIPADSFPLAE